MNAKTKVTNTRNLNTNQITTPFENAAVCSGMQPINARSPRAEQGLATLGNSCVSVTDCFQTLLGEGHAPNQDTRHNFPITVFGISAVDRNVGGGCTVS